MWKHNQPQAILHPSGTVNTSRSENGLWDNYGTGLIPENTDNLDEVDFLDTDSDNDGTPDIQENAMANIYLRNRY